MSFTNSTDVKSHLRLPNYSLFWHPMTYGMIRSKKYIGAALSVKSKKLELFSKQEKANDEPIVIETGKRTQNLPLFNSKAGCFNSKNGETTTSDMSESFLSTDKFIPEKCCNVIGSFGYKVERPFGYYNDGFTNWNHANMNQSQAINHSQENSHCNLDHSYQDVLFPDISKQVTQCCYKQFCLAKRGLFCCCSKHMSNDKVIGENEEIVSLAEALQNNAIFRDLSCNVFCDFLDDNVKSNRRHVGNLNTSSIASTSFSTLNSSNSFVNSTLSNSSSDRYENCTLSTISPQVINVTSNFPFREVQNEYKMEQMKENRQFFDNAEHDDEILEIKLEALKRRRERTRELQKEKKKRLQTINQYKSNTNSNKSIVQEFDNKENINPIDKKMYNDAFYLVQSKDDHLESNKNNSGLFQNGICTLDDKDQTSSKFNKTSVNSSDPEHYRRYSTRFTKEQTAFMRAWYENNRHNPYASEKTIEKLAEESNLPTRSVRKWLSNRRTRLLETRTYRKIKRSKI